jgi:putative transposase
MRSRGQRRRFRSVILPPWCRKSPKVAEVLPLLYLHGLSTGDFVPALEGFLGSAAGLSSASITRLSKQWSDDYHASCRRDLSGVDYVYVWVDGIHVNLRLEEDKLCLLVIVGMRADGTKELVALADGYRESTGSWADLLRECARRGMRAPVLAVGDGALGFSAALREVFPDTRAQQCWLHKVANVLSALPQVRPAGGEGPPSRRSTTRKTSGTRRPLPRRSRTRTGRSFPRQPRRSATTWTCCSASTTTRPNTGSTYAPPTRSSRRLLPSGTAPGSRRARAAAPPGWPWPSNSSESAQQRWRAVNAPHLVALVRAGADFERGLLVERAEGTAA